jgi:hypothetical protein
MEWLLTEIDRQEEVMRKIFNYGGLIAAVILIAFGIASIVMGANGRDTVRSNLGNEAIVGSPDMTPTAIAAEAKAAGLKGVSLPTKSVAGQSINTGSEARAFAEYMRIHALEASQGKTYAEMPRFATADGKGTNNDKAALKDPKTGRPVDNAARNVWVTETALSTALNTSYFAENVALFSIVMGVALLLTGFGFGIMALGLLPAGLRRESTSTTKVAPKTAVAAS